MQADVVAVPVGPSLNRGALLPAAAFLALVVAMGTGLSSCPFIAAVGLGVSGAGGAAWWVSLYARRSSVGRREDRLVLREIRTRECVIAERRRGKLLVVSEVQGGIAGSDTWLLWFDETGAGRWTAKGRRWPTEPLLSAARTLEIPIETLDEPQSTSALRKRYPANVSWVEAHTMATIVLVTLVPLLGVSIGLALLDINVP